MIIPNYKKDNLVNLTGSILKLFNQKSLYPPLDGLALKKRQNTILLVIDGLGWECLKKYGSDSFFKKHLVKKLTSVFPSTTASAAISLQTGVAPQQHGITGWIMSLKELGIVAKVLPFNPRYSKTSLAKAKVKKSDIYLEPEINQKIKNPAFTIYPDEIFDGYINKRSKTTLGYKTLNGMFLQIQKVVKSSSQQKYIYAYWGEFDALCHKKGWLSSNAEKHFLKLDQAINRFNASLQGTDSTLIVTADHGFIDTSLEKTIHLRDHPKLYETLTLPLCGEPRLAYCYVHPGKFNQFKKYVKSKLRHCCSLYESRVLLERGFFGLGEPHPMLKERIGDFTLIMKENYIIKDHLINEKEKIKIGAHGGVSKEEMWVPLIVINN